MMPSHLLKLVCFFAVFLTLSQARDVTKVEVSYAKPTKWKDAFEKCGGSNQSPIDIKAKKAKKDASKMVTFSGWDVVEPTMKDHYSKNDNRVMWWSELIKAKIILDSNTYQFSFTVFLWGSDGKKGSEHSIDGKFYSGESQFIFINTKYADLRTAYDKDDGIAAIAFFYNENKDLAEDVPFLKVSKYFLKRLATNDSIQVSTPRNYRTARWVLFKDMSGYRYKGSSTFPPCYENVEWLVVKKPVDVTSTFLTDLRTLKDSKGEPLSDKRRPSQNLNGREVFEVNIPKPW